MPEPSELSVGPGAGPFTVLLDLDGTLSDSAPGIVASLRAAFADLGVEWISDETARSLLGPPFALSLPRYVGPERLDEAIAAYRRHYVAGGGMFDTQVYPGVFAALTELASAGLRLAVATSKPEPYAQGVLEHLELDGFFTTIGGDTLDGARGSKALVIAEVLSRLGNPAPNTVVMVGDRSHDVLGAAAHGIACLGARWGYGSVEELTAAGALAVCATASELPAAVASALAPGGAAYSRHSAAAQEGKR
jgi:phosphoglycolate phosphatase